VLGGASFSHTVTIIVCTYRRHDCTAQSHAFGMARASTGAGTRRLARGAWGSDRLPTLGRSTAGCSCRSLRGMPCPGRMTRNLPPPPLLLAAARARPRPARSPAPRSASCAPFVLCAARPVATRRFLPRGRWAAPYALGVLPDPHPPPLSAFLPAAPVCVG